MEDDGHLSTFSTSNISFRQIQPEDHNDIKKLHEEFFPVRYVDAFYDDAVLGRGIGGQPLITIIATVPMEKNGKSSQIIGFIFAQFMATRRCDERNLFYATNTPPKLFYILTLGVKQEYRKLGLATALVQKCIVCAKNDSSCGLIYLHVIHYNQAAIRLYETLGFQHIKTLTDFYTIEDKVYDSYLYGFYINDYQGQILTLFVTNLRYYALSHVLLSTFPLILFSLL